MITSVGRNKYITLRLFAVFILVITMVITLACLECETGLIPGDSGTSDSQEFSEIDVNANTASPALTVAILVIMALTLVAVGYGISRKSGEKKNLSRQQKRAQTKQMEKKNNSKKKKNNNKKK